MAMRTRTQAVPLHALPRLDDILPDVLPLDSYITKFSRRYRDEQSFRDIVHKYLNLSRGQRFSLGVSKYFLPSHYQHRTDAMLQQYAAKIRSGLMTARQAQEELHTLRQTETELARYSVEVRETHDADVRLGNLYATAEAARAAAVGVVEAEFTERTRSLEERATQEIEGVRRETDAKALAETALRRTVESLPFLKMNQGSLEFDEHKLVERLQDLFLDEVIEGIEREEGTGFMAKVRARYREVLANWAEIEDLGQIDEVEWVESVILSRTKGYHVPQFPYMIAAQYEQSAMSTLGKTSIDSAFSVDASGSMDTNSRFVVARKAAFAATSLMRQLNPRNQMYLSVFRDSVEELAALDMLRAMNAGGGTRTELALDWMRGKLERSGPSFAYLITDGDPNFPDQAIEAAARYRNTDIFLRIFLIDGEPRTEAVIREIGKAAGPHTKVLPVKEYQMGGAIVKDIAASLRGMYDIANF